MSAAIPARSQPAQAAQAAQEAVNRLGALLDTFETDSPASIDAFLAAVAAARTAVPDAADPVRAQIESAHTRGLSALGRDAEAEAALRAALAFTRGDNPGRAQMLLDLAEHCVARRESAAVLDLTEQVAGMCTRVPDLARNPELRTTLLCLQCQTAIDLGRQERIAALAAQLAELAPMLEPGLRRSVQLQRGNAMLALSAWQPLEQLAQQELADADLDPGLRAQWQLRHGQALSEVARLDSSASARAQHELEAALASGLLDELEQDDTLLALAELDLRTHAPEAARARLEACAARHAPGAAQSREPGASEPELPGLDPESRARFQALAIEVALATKASREDLARLRASARTTLGAVREEWLQRPLVPGGQSFLLFSEARFLLGQLLRVEIALEGERAGVEAALEMLALLQGAGTAARALDPGRIDVARLRRELLADDTTLLVILPDSLRTHACVLGPQGALAGEGAPFEQLEVLRDEHRRWLQAPPAAAHPERARALRETAERFRDAVLDARVIAELRARPVLVVAGDDLLGGFPIEALDLNGERPFGCERAIVHAPSLPIALALARRRDEPPRSGPWDAVVFGAPLQSSAARGLEPLKLGAAELRRLGEAFEPARVLLLDGAQATLAGLHTPELAAARVLQVLTHGVYDVSRVEPTGLLVAPGPDGADVAWRADLRSLAAPPVVGLWACGTARGPGRFGDDTAAHLGGAFLEAGTCSVVLSPADIALGPTLRMARCFGRELSRGESPAEALRAARSEVAGDPATADPFFYASVVLYGEAGRRDPPRARAAASLPRVRPLQRPERRIPRARRKGVRAGS